MALTNPRAAFEEPPAIAAWDFEDQQNFNRQIAEALNRVFLGHLAIIGEVTLTANDTTTTLSDDRIGPQSVILLHPKTANAAAIDAPIYTTRERGSVVLTHANDANADKTFYYVVIGV